MPHSEIHGSKLIRSSPRLIAAYHVLLRLCMPRHPPNALTTLNRSHCQCSSSSCYSNGIISGPGYLLQPNPLNNAIDVFDQVTLLELRRAARLCLILRPASRDQIRDRAVSKRPSVKSSEIFPGQVQTTPTTTDQSDKLPSYLRSLLRVRSARPSTTSLEPGSDIRA